MPIGGESSGARPSGAPTMLRSVGTSASSTPGTVVASVTAAGGKKLLGVNAFGGQVNAANTQVSIQVTYTDATLETAISTTPASVDTVQAMSAGGWRGGSAFQAFSTSKDIQKVEVLTLGVGTGLRTGFVTALEVVY